MHSNSSKIDKHQSSKVCEIEALPEDMQQLYLSGKSVLNLSHLAKNIIQVVSGSAEIIQLGLKRKQYDCVQRSWDIFEPNFIRLKKFVLDLIKYTKHYPLQKTICDFNKLVKNAISANSTLLKNRNVKIQLSEDRAIKPVSLDADKIEEMVANLITHALDNLPEHAGAISITTQYLRDHQQIQLSVRDDGLALTNEAIRSLGEPQEQTRDMCGTGFDIPLAKLYIEQHNGYMDLESAPEKGNCVNVYLPIQ
ncbi:MAG: HAMP domain-containing histidine kinase [Phycisphaerae bacterium]|nr:HAMP domain-containing histidine kinase [Phycisphaerae bacterium]